MGKSSSQLQRHKYLHRQLSPNLLEEQTAGAGRDPADIPTNSADVPLTPPITADRQVNGYDAPGQCVIELATDGDFSMR